MDASLSGLARAAARSARADRRRARRGRARRDRRDAAEGRAAASPMPRRMAAAKAAAVAERRRARPRRRHRRRGRPAHPAQGRDRGRGARRLRCSPAAATASISAVTLIDARRPGAAPPVDLDRRLQAARARRSSPPISPAANGAARPAAMRSRAAPRRWSGGSPAPIRAWSACRSTRRAPCSAPPAIPLAEWLYEEGIGENRAILVEDDEIIEARDRASGRDALRLRPGRPPGPDRHPRPPRNRRDRPGRGDGRAAAGGAHRRGRRCGWRSSANPLPSPATRSSPRAGSRMPPNAKVRASRSGSAAGTPLSPHGPDRFEESGWSELIDEAIEGVIDFGGGELRMSLTPAMTLFDVDGFLPPAELAMAGAEAAALAIRRLDIGGSIGIDLPTIPSARTGCGSSPRSMPCCRAVRADGGQRLRLPPGGPPPRAARRCPELLHGTRPAPQPAPCCAGPSARPAADAASPPRPSIARIEPAGLDRRARAPDRRRGRLAGGAGASPYRPAMSTA